MEKLSDATEALHLQTEQLQQQKREKRQLPRSESPRLSSDAVHMHHSSSAGCPDVNKTSKLITPVEVHSTGSTHSLERVGKTSPRRHHHNVAVDTNVTSQTIPVEALPLPDRRGTGFLPPINPSRSPQLTARQDAHISSSGATSERTSTTKTRTRTHRRTASHGKGKKRLLPQITEKMASPPIPENYKDQLQTYLNSYRDDQSAVSSLSDLSDGSQLSQDSRDKLGASIFSRHATTRHSHGPHPLPKISSPPHSLSQGHSPLHSPPPFIVQEGSLALGPSAREAFTTQTQLVRPKHRTRRNPQVQTRIVPRASLNPSKGSPDPLDSQTCMDPLGHQQPSKVCLLV